LSVCQNPAQPHAQPRQTDRQGREGVMAGGGGGGGYGWLVHGSAGLMCKWGRDF
jgi:hypothetical protein